MTMFITKFPLELLSGGTNIQIIHGFKEAKPLICLTVA